MSQSGNTREGSQQERGVGFSHGEGWWRRERLGTRIDKVPAQERRRDCGPLEDDQTVYETPASEGHRSACQKKELEPMVLVAPGKGEGIQVEIKGESKTVVHWINGEAGQSSAWGAVGEVQTQLRERRSKAANLRRMEDDKAVHLFRAWAEKESKRSRD